jgi:hypothetical protein
MWKKVRALEDRSRRFNMQKIRIPKGYEEQMEERQQSHKEKKISLSCRNS